MTGRGNRIYRSKSDNRQITDEDAYLMIMLYQYQRKSIARIARQFGLDTAEVRTIIGKKTGGSCCG